jgi:hypothetical protein
VYEKEHAMVHVIHQYYTKVDAVLREKLPSSQRIPQEVVLQ